MRTESSYTRSELGSMPFEPMSSPRIDKSSAGARRAYLSASAESQPTGDVVTYSRSSESSPETWSRFEREAEKMREEIEAEDLRERRDRGRLEMIEKRIEENRERAEREARRESREPARVQTRDSRGRRISASSTGEELDSSYSISIGLGEMPIEELGREISSRILGGAMLEPALGVWDGELERCARVTYYGGAEGAEEILELLAELLPEEETVAIAIGAPRILFEELDEYRDLEKILEPASASYSHSMMLEELHAIEPASEEISRISEQREKPR